MVYTFSLSRRSLPVRCLCVLLCLLVLWCFFLVPRVGAVVAEAELAYWGGAIVVSVLAAGGMALATGDAQKVGSAMYAALKDTGGKAWDSIQAMAAWAASAGSKVKDAAFRVGKDVWQAITDCFNASYSNGAFTYTGVSSSVDVYNADKVCSFLNKKYLNSIQFIDVDGAVHQVFVSYIDGKWYAFHNKNGIQVDKIGYITGNSSDTAFLLFNYSNHEIDYLLRVMCEGSTVGGSSFYPILRLSSDGLPISVNQSIPFTGSVALPPPDLVYPGDDYLVKAPDLPAVDTATGAVSWPSDAVYNKDAIALPYPIDAAGQKVADIPFDVPVDQTTGKTLDDADTGTDTDKPGADTDKPGTDTGGLLGQIVALLKNFFDSPGDFRLNMDGFRNLVIKDKFPFCIPFDMVDSVKQFAADAADYQFCVKLDTQYFKVDHVVDLTPLAVPLAFFRYLVVAWFAWVLMSRTHDLMKW